MNKPNIYKNLVLRKIKFNFKILQSRTVKVLIKLRFKYFNLLSNPVGNAKNNNKDVQVILDPVNKGWVIEKIAKNLISRKSSNLTLDLFYIPRRGYRITHWMHYLNVSRDFIKTDKGIHTFLVPHIDSIQKEHEFLLNINAGAFPIFLSRDHAERTSKRLKLDLIPHYISPGSDLAEEKLRFRVVISTHIYPDGRKKEHLLIQLAQEISLKNFHFIFIGKSWSKVEESVRKSGATVEWFNPNNSPFPNYKQSLDIMRGCDVFLYLGSLPIFEIPQITNKTIPPIITKSTSIIKINLILPPSFSEKFPSILSYTHFLASFSFVHVLFQILHFVQANLV